MAGTAPDTTENATPLKARTFISYSRADAEFVDRLEQGLNSQGFETYLDRRDIHYFENWEDRIGKLIVKADTIIFVLSPDAVASPNCEREVQLGLSLNKRFAPIIFRSVSAKLVPETLRRPNWLRFDGNEPFESRLEDLARALLVDIDWVRKHTQFTEQALQWMAMERRKGRVLLLRSSALDEAQTWMASRPLDAPVPSNEVREFIEHSKRAAVRARRFFRTVWSVVFSILSGAVISSSLLYRTAETQRATATQQRNVAQVTQSLFLADVANQNLANGDASTALLVSLEGLPAGGPGTDSRPYVPQAEYALNIARRGLREKYVVGVGRFATDLLLNKTGDRLLVVARNEPIAQVELREMSTGKRLAVLDRRYPLWRAPPTKGKFSPDGHYAVTFSDTLTVWDARTGELVSETSVFDRISGHADNIQDISFSEDGRRLVSGSVDKTARVWSFPDIKPLAVLEGHTNSVVRAYFALGDSRVVTISSDATIKSWDPSGGSPLASAEEPSGIQSLSEISPDGKLLAIPTATANYPVHLWDIASLRVSMSIVGHRSSVTSVSFDSASNRLIASSADGSVVVRDVISGRVIQNLNAQYDGAVKSAQFSSDGKSILTYQQQGSIARLWNAETGEPIASLGGHHVIDSAAISSNGNSVIIADLAGTVRLWETDGIWGPTVIETGKRSVASTMLTADGQKVVLGFVDGAVEIWDIKNKIPELKLDQLTGPVLHLSMNSDGSAILAATQNGDCRIFHTADHHIVGLESSKDDLLLDAVINPSGTQAAISFISGIVQLNDTETGRALANVKLDNSFAVNLSFSPDGRTIALTDKRKNTVKLLIWNDFSVTEISLGKGTKVAAFDKKTGRLAVGRLAGNVDIRQASTADLVMRLSSPREVERLAFSQDGVFLFGATRQEVLVWRADQREPVDTISNSRIWQSALSVDPSGSKLAAPCQEDACVWSLIPQLSDSIESAKEMVPRCLDEKQRQRFFLSADPPYWCIEHAKWPYISTFWVSWLQFRKAGFDVVPPFQRLSLSGLFFSDGTQADALKAENGARVALVQSGSAAAIAGIQVNDMVVEVNGIPVMNRSDGQVLIDTAISGRNLNITLKRGAAVVKFNFVPQPLDAAR